MRNDNYLSLRILIWLTTVTAHTLHMYRLKKNPKNSTPILKIFQNSCMFQISLSSCARAGKHQLQFLYFPIPHFYISPFPISPEMKESSYFGKFWTTLQVRRTSQDGQVSALLVENQLQNVTDEQHCDLCFSMCLEYFPFISIMMFPNSLSKWFWREFILQLPYFNGRINFFFVPANTKELEKLIKLLTLKNRG